jgi:hypothetical protein
MAGGAGSWPRGGAQQGGATWAGREIIDTSSAAGPPTQEEEHR